MIKLLSYNKYSASCKRLKELLLAGGVKKAITVETGRKVKAGDFVVVWGSSKHANYVDNMVPCNMLLNGRLSPVVTNKRDFFSFCNRHLPDIVPRSVNKKEAIPALFKAMTGTDKTIVCRTKLTGSGGEGIVLITENTPAEEIPDCRLFVEYIKKAREFRVHVFGRNTFVQEKLRRGTRLAEGSIDYKVRNLENGWVYVHTPEVQQLAGGTSAVKMLKSVQELVRMLGLHFGAVDIIYNEKKDRYYVLEVNSAPGVMDESLEFYATNIKEEYEAKKENTFNFSPAEL